MSLCSVLIPSRWRTEKLFRCVESIIATAGSDDFDIRIRVDDDDPCSYLCIDELQKSRHVKVFVGPSPGYADLDAKAYTPMAESSSAAWIWIMNDDMIVQKTEFGWCELLEKVPTWGHWVQPGIHRLNNSQYPRDERSCAPIFPNGCWRELGICDIIPTPCDAAMPEQLKIRKWTPWFLEGITIWHQREK